LEIEGQHTYYCLISSGNRYNVPGISIFNSTFNIKNCPGETMEVNISDLTWAPFIYPRGGKSERTINAYVEALAIGAQFPLIKIQ